MQKIASRRAKFWVLKLIGKIGLLTYGKQYRAGEITFDDLANDGLLEVSSAKHPYNQPHKDFAPAHNAPGVWQVMPENPGDHGVAIGMKVSKEQTQAFYLGMMQLLASTE